MATELPFAVVGEDVYVSELASNKLMQKMDGNSFNGAWVSNAARRRKKFTVENRQLLMVESMTYLSLDIKKPFHYAAAVVDEGSEGTPLDVDAVQPRGPCARFRHMSLRCELASSRKTTFENEKGPPSYKGRGCSLGSGVRWRHRPSRRQCARGLCSRWRLLRLLRLLRVLQVLRLLRCSVRTVEIDEGEDR